VRSLLDALYCERYALAYTDAHGSQRPLCSGFLQLMNGRQYQPRSAHSQRMAQGDRAAVRVDLRRVIRNSELPQTRKRLTGESLIHFDEIKIFNGKLQPRKKLLS